MNRKNCLSCGLPLFGKPLYICRNMPAKSQDLPTEETIKDDKPVDFNLCQCSGCGLVQFDCEPVPYYLDSTRAGERCEALINLRREQYTHLIETYNLKGKRIIEIGAGKGGFLKTLKEMTEYSIEEYGIEHNADFVKIAREVEGVNVVRMNPEDENLRIEGAPFDAFVSFAYPARLIDPNSMLRGVYKNLKDDAVGLVQVPSLEHLIKPGGFFDITADHIAYYDTNTFRFLLQKNGFDVLEEGEVGDTYIYAIVRKRQRINLKEIWSDVDMISKEVVEYVNNTLSANKRIAIWCAGHFAFTILSITGIASKISYVIDNADFKQGCYTPATHVKIVAPEYYKNDPVDVVMILGPLYVDELVTEIKNKLNRDIEIITVGRNGIKQIQ